MNDHKLQPCEKRTIYQGIRKLMVGAEGVVGGMSKMHKYTLGSRLCQRLEMLQETTLKAYQAVGNPSQCPVRKTGCKTPCPQPSGHGQPCDAQQSPWAYA
jgi:hypothetical protein